MKPTKNQVFCIGCHKHKMLFESKNKADNFIKYNAGEILEENEKAPVRSYYCTLCLGWHVTSNPSVVDGERHDERDEKLFHMIDQFKKNKVEFSVIAQRVNNKLQDFDMYLRLSDFDKAEDILDICGFEIEEVKSFKMIQDKVGRLQERVRKAHERLEYYKMLNDMSHEEQDAILNNAEPTKNERKDIAIIKDLRSLKIIYSVIESSELLISSDDSSTVDEIFRKCRHYIMSLSSGETSGRAKTRLNKQLDTIVMKRKSYQADNAPVENNEPEDLLDNEKACDNTELNQLSEPYSDEYKANIIELITKIESIRNEYEEGNYIKCNDTLDLCYLILDTMKKDDNTMLIQNQLDKWKSNLLHIPFEDC